MAASGKTVVLITGCSPGGIGYVLAVEFHRRACFVIATARNPSLIRDLADMGICTLQLDVTDPASIAACKDTTNQMTSGKLHILVNNAGRRHTIPALDIDLEDVKATFDTNVFGPMRMNQAFADLLIPAQGLIINISSNSTLGPYLFGSAFASSKGAINVYSRSLRMELLPFNVRVMVAMTGTVRSEVASHTFGDLPQSSRYKPVEDLFQKRLSFSQHTHTMPAEEYAQKLVAAALKGPGWCNGWIGGTPDLFWAGGMSSISWMTTWFPDWLTDILIARFFNVPTMVHRLQQSAYGHQN